MSDLFLELGQRPWARKLVKSAGLPLPLPQTLKRRDGALQQSPLTGSSVFFEAFDGSELATQIRNAISIGGAKLVSPSSEAELRPVRSKVDAVVLDVSHLDGTVSLDALYETLHPRLRSIRACGRVILVSRSINSGSPTQALAVRAAEGFMRSLAKELGGKGITVNMLSVEVGAEHRLAGPLRWLLSARSAFVTGQVVRVNMLARDYGTIPAHGLHGKIALVTGAAQGIGAETATTLAVNGAHVVLLDVPGTEDKLNDLARSLNGTAVFGDVTDPELHTSLRKLLEEEMGGLDIVVHNAGITRDRTLGRMKRKYWDAVLNVNLRAVEELQAELEPIMRDYGRVITLASIAGIAGNMGQTAYAATKAGAWGFAQGSAHALAARGITANAIAPGFIETRMTAAIPMAIRQVARRLSALSQGGLPRDVAETITFLCTPDAQGISGEVVRVCGGAFVGA